MSNKAECFDCGLPYGEENWVEAVIPDAIWNDIRPEGAEKGCGLLCIGCMSARLLKKEYRKVPVWLAGTEPLQAMIGDPAHHLDILRTYSRAAPHTQ